MNHELSQQIDAFVTQLCQRHQHTFANFNGRWWHNNGYGWTNINARHALVRAVLDLRDEISDHESVEKLKTLLATTWGMNQVTGRAGAKLLQLYQLPNPPATVPEPPTPTAGM